MRGAQALIRTLVGAGVTTCFTNPGTSEMHFVAALDEVPRMRAVLTLFEGVATGAADGFGRMTGGPAATLLHLGPGLGNGLANLHNARRARTPLVNVIGAHATHHAAYDPPLQSDIETVARNVSRFVRTATSTKSLCTDAVEAVAAARRLPGQVATLIVPADVSWSDGAEPVSPLTDPAPAEAGDDAVGAAHAALTSGEPCAVLLGGQALRGDALRLAGRAAATTGARLLGETFPARMQHGAGLPTVTPLPYLVEYAVPLLEPLRHLVLVDAASPVSFFAYPGMPSDLVPSGCTVHRLADAGSDVTGALARLAERTAASPSTVAASRPAARPAPPSGPLAADTVCQAIGATLPEGAIVSDEANTSGFTLPAATAGAPVHDVLRLTGGAIGQGLPVAVGAAVACPDRPVLALEADGSSLYTVQSLWTMAREQLDVTVVLFNNRSYAILAIELDRVGATAPGPRARAQLDLAQPALDFVAISTGLGVPATRPTSCEELLADLRRAYAEPGPHLIEVRVP